MAKKGGNKKKSNARKTQKKVVTTPTANPSTPEESSPVTPVNALDNDKANVLTESIDQNVTKEEQNIEEIKKEEEEAKQTENPSILSNASEEAITSTSENIVESLDVKETLEEPPHVQVEAKPVAVTLDTLTEVEQPVVITLEKSIIPEEQQQTINVEPVPVEISPVLPKVETEEVPLLQEKKQDQEPVVLVVSESETTSTEEEQQASATNQDQLTPEATIATTTAEQQIASEKERVATVEPATIATTITTEEDFSSSAKPEIQEHKVVEQIQENKQEPEQILTHKSDQVPEQNEPKNLVPQVTLNETENVHEPHVSEPVTSVIAEETSQLADDKEINQKEATAEFNENQHAATTTQSEQQVASVPPVDIVDDVDQVIVPAQTDKETTPAVSTTSLEKEDTPTVRSQSVLTSTNTDATINEEEIITPKSSLKKSRSVLGSKDKSVTKRKSQILGLFKRGGDKTPLAVPELPMITEKKQAEKKLNKRKSWMFWKSSTAVAGQQKN